MQDIVDIDRKRAVELIDKFAKFIVEKRLGSAAIMTVESLKPLSGISSQALYALSPFVEVFFKQKDIQEIAVMLGKSEYVDLFVRRVDELDEEMHREERKQARIKRKRKRKLMKDKWRYIINKINIFKK